MLKRSINTVKRNYCVEFELDTLYVWNRIRENVINSKNVVEAAVTYLGREFNYNSGLISESLNHEFTRIVLTPYPSKALDYVNL